MRVSRPRGKRGHGVAGPGSPVRGGRPSVGRAVPPLSLSLIYLEGVGWVPRSPDPDRRSQAGDRVSGGSGLFSEFSSLTLKGGEICFVLFFYSLPGIPPFPLSVGRLNLHHLDALVADLWIMRCSAARRTRAEHAPNNAEF